MLKLVQTSKYGVIRFSRIPIGAKQEPVTCEVWPGNTGFYCDHHKMGIHCLVNKRTHQIFSTLNLVMNPCEIPILLGKIFKWRMIHGEFLPFLYALDVAHDFPMKGHGVYAKAPDGSVWIIELWKRRFDWPVPGGYVQPNTGIPNMGYHRILAMAIMAGVALAGDMGQWKVMRNGETGAVSEAYFYGYGIVVK